MTFLVSISALSRYESLFPNCCGSMCVRRQSEDNVLETVQGSSQNL